MVQNRNRFIILLLGNLANAIVHKILEKSSNEPELSGKYRKELLNSLEIAKSYRSKINPADFSLAQEDRESIRLKIIKKVTSELTSRISKGYVINLALVESEVDLALKELKII